MDELRDIGCFVAVAETRSFTRASARLGMPVSTVSRRVSELEASLGLRLFNRNTRTVELTEAGSLYYGRCRTIVEEARHARDEARARVGQPRGSLRISVETEIGPRLVRPVVAKYLQAYPDVSIQLDLSPRRVDLIADGFDIAIRIGHLPDSAITVRRLGLLRAHLFAAPAYLGQFGVPADPSQLARHRRIQLMHKADDGAWRLTRGGDTVEVAGGAVICTNSMTMARGFALDRLGIAVIDEVLAHADVGSGALVRVLPEWSLHRYPLSLLLPSRLVPLRSRLFVDMLVRQVASTPGLDRH